MEHSEPRNYRSLSRYLAIAWCILTVYGSLYPFSGWQNFGLAPFDFLFLPWPRYWTAFDLIVNIIVYFPLGFFATLALRRVPGRFSAPLLATLLGLCLSLSMEILQSWLPTRVASNVDLGSNTLGALIGSVAAVSIGHRAQDWWRSFRQKVIAPLPHVDLGLALLGLWLLTLLSPETLLFGTGDLRQILTWMPSLSYSPDVYRLAETAVVASNLVAVGLFAGAMTAGRWRAFLIVPGFFALAILVRSLGAAILAGPENFLQWWTPGVVQGLSIGSMVLGVGLLFSGTVRLILAALALMVGIVFVNLAPVDPYSLAALTLWRQGHFLNFNGLTRWVSTIWPLMALAYLTMVRQRA